MWYTDVLWINDYLYIDEKRQKISIQLTVNKDYLWKMINLLFECPSAPSIIALLSALNSFCRSIYILKEQVYQIALGFIIDMQNNYMEGKTSD